MNFRLRLAASAAVLLALSGLAFWPSYLSRLPAAGLHLHVHAALGVGWLLCLVVQPLLVQGRQVRAHRVVGAAAVVLGMAFVASGVVVSHRSLVRLDEARFVREGAFVYLPLAMACLFAAALTLGLAWRRVPAVHGRFMACTALPLLDPLFARLLFHTLPPLPADFLYQVPAFAVASMLLLHMARSLPAGLPGRAAFGGFAAFGVAAMLVFFTVPYGSFWLQAAAWFRALPLS